MFDLTTGQWLFCSIFSGVCTVLYMVHLFQVEEEKRMLEEQKIMEEGFNDFLDFLEKICNEEPEEEQPEEEQVEEEDEKEDNED